MFGWIFWWTSNTSVYVKTFLERERAFLKDCYSAYETVGFADKFWSPFDLKDEDKK